MAPRPLRDVEPQIVPVGHLEGEGVVVLPPVEPVDLDIDGVVVPGDGGAGEASFPLVVEGGSALNWPLMLVAVAVVASAVILIARYRRNARA